MLTRDSENKITALRKERERLEKAGQSISSEVMKVNSNAIDDELNNTLFPLYDLADQKYPEWDAIYNRLK